MYFATLKTTEMNKFIVIGLKQYNTRVSKQHICKLLEDDSLIAI